MHLNNNVKHICVPVINFFWKMKCDYVSQVDMTRIQKQTKWKDLDSTLGWTRLWRKPVEVVGVKTIGCGDFDMWYSPYDSYPIPVVFPILQSCTTTESGSTIEVFG